jgi:hypothetical protein
VSEEAGFSPELVKRLTGIVGLQVDERRAASLAPQLAAIRDDVAKLGALDLVDVEPLPSPVRPESSDAG